MLLPVQSIDLMIFFPQTLRRMRLPLIGILLLVAIALMITTPVILTLHLLLISVYISVIKSSVGGEGVIVGHHDVGGASICAAFLFSWIVNGDAGIVGEDGGFGDGV